MGQLAGVHRAQEGRGRAHGDAASKNSQGIGQAVGGPMGQPAPAQGVQVRQWEGLWVLTQCACPVWVGLQKY